MRPAAALLLLLALAACTPRRTAVEGATPACPPEHEDTRLVVTDLLDDPADAAEFGVSGFRAADVRLLADPVDSATCAGLRALFPPHRDTILVDSYFTASRGGRVRYFVSRTLRPLPPPLPGDSVVHVQYGMDAVGVYNEAFRSLGGRRRG